MMKVEDISKDYMLAKTGRSMTNIRWYVGYVEKGENVYFFAANMQAQEGDHPNVAKETSLAALKNLGILN